MKNFLLLCAVLFCGVTAHAQTKDQQAIVTVVNAALTAKSPQVLPLVLAENVQIFTPDGVLFRGIASETQSKFVKSQAQFSNANLRIVIDVDNAKLVNNDNTASFFCVARVYEGKAEKPLATYVHTMFLTKFGTSWKISVWQQGQWKQMVAPGEWGD